jgi:hypothetical protein
MMSRLTSLFVLVALVLPGAAFGATLDENGIDQAAAHRKAVAVQEYYASHRNGTSLPVPAREPAATDGGGVSPSLAIGAGIALILFAGGLGVYFGRTVRPRHLGA